MILNEKFLSYLYGGISLEHHFQQFLTLIHNKFNFTWELSENLCKACFHSSFINEHRLLFPPTDNVSLLNNERLEWIGDTVVQLIVSESLYQRFPELPEGTLSKLRTNFVNGEFLGELVKQENLFSGLLMGQGFREENNKLNFEKISLKLLGDFLESLVGAVYFDYGLETAKIFLLKLLAYHPLWLKLSKTPLIALENENNLLGLLQEKCCQLFFEPPLFSDREVGEQEFLVSLLLKRNHDILWQGQKTSRAKKIGKKDLALAALKFLAEFEKEL
jgi:ribonuclease-3